MAYIPEQTTLPPVAQRKKLVNESQLAALNDGVFTVSTLRSWRFKRVGPPYYKLMNRKVLYNPDEVAAWLETGRIDPEAD